MSTSKTDKKFACKCGDVRLTLKGDPFLNFICHCGDCRAAQDHCNAKAAISGKENIPSDVNGGVGAAFWSFKNIIVDSTDLKEKLVFIKTGAKGSMVRSYCRGCNTLVVASTPPVQAVSFNRHCLTNAADDSPYKIENGGPIGQVCYNLMAEFAVDPPAVPEPKYDGVPLGILRLLMRCGSGDRGELLPMVLKKMCCGICCGPKRLDPAFTVPPAEAEIVEKNKLKAQVIQVVGTSG